MEEWEGIGGGIGVSGVDPRPAIKQEQKKNRIGTNRWPGSRLESWKACKKKLVNYDAEKKSEDLLPMCVVSLC